MALGVNSDEQMVILAVDDVVANIDVICAILKPEFKVKVALSGEQALRIVAKGCPDLVLLDLVMPCMDGYEVYRQLKNDSYSRDIPIIFVSGNDISGVDGLSFEDVVSISKPIEPDELRGLVRSSLGL